MTRSFVAALALAVVLPALAAAQDDVRPRERGTDRERPRVQMFSYNRVRLGVTVQTRADSETDRLGAKIISVVEDGPAAKAGLKEGDIITRFGSTSLAGARPEDQDEDDEVSGPGLRLVELARELDEGDTVKVEYRRGGSSHTATIVAEEVGADFAFEGFRGPSMVMPKVPGGGNFRFYGEPGEMHFEGPGDFTMFMGRGRGLQMVEMNADLGEYFGTNEGLLVTRASGDSTIPIRTGDVLLSIDGRKPSSVAHAYRIISSYEDGETVRAEVMRKRQRVNLEWTVKEPESRVRTLLPSRRPLSRERRPNAERTRL